MRRSGGQTAIRRSPVFSIQRLVEMPGEFARLGSQSVELSPLLQREILQSLRDVQHVCQFGQRSNTNVEIATELARAAFGRSFGDVCTGANGGSSSLGRQTVQFIAREGLGDFVHGNGKIIARSPSTEPFEGHHVMNVS